MSVSFSWIICILWQSVHKHGCSTPYPMTSVNKSVVNMPKTRKVKISQANVMQAATRSPWRSRMVLYPGTPGLCILLSLLRFLSCHLSFLIKELRIQHLEDTSGKGKKMRKETLCAYVNHSREEEWPS